MATPAAALAISTPAHRLPGRHFSVVGAEAAWAGWLSDAMGCNVRAPRVGCCEELWVATTPLPD
eukprot:3242471-Pleurochrysis_carterae.AAC.2